MNDRMLQTYDLEKDREYVERIQMATVQSAEFALRTEHGLLGTQRWWAALASGDIPTLRAEGRIVDVRVDAGWPEFELEVDGVLSSWCLEGDVQAYQIGNVARVDFVELEYQEPVDGDASVKVVLRILVER